MPDFLIYESRGLSASPGIGTFLFLPWLPLPLSCGLCLLSAALLGLSDALLILIYSSNWSYSWF